VIRLLGSSILINPSLDFFEALSKLQRKAQFRLDFVAAENSMGFHAPQEVARILAEAIDYARQGEITVVRSRK
jgi:nitrite reductase (cytochrome c-552)